MAVLWYPGHCCSNCKSITDETVWSVSEYSNTICCVHACDLLWAGVYALVPYVLCACAVRCRVENKWFVLPNWNYNICTGMRLCVHMCNVYVLCVCICLLYLVLIAFLLRLQKPVSLVRLSFEFLINSIHTGSHISHLISSLQQFIVASVYVEPYFRISCD